MTAGIVAQDAKIVCKHSGGFCTPQGCSPLLQANDPVSAGFAARRIARERDQENDRVRVATDALLGQSQRMLHLSDHGIRIETQTQLLFGLCV